MSRSDTGYRIVFVLAGAYNLALGAWAVVTPGAFFDVFALEQPRYHSIWQTLGMVLGLYGLLYVYAAYHIDRARPIIAIGLLGKICGPIGWVLSVSSGELPLRTFPLIAFDDLIWWVPFCLFLARAGIRPKQPIT